MKIRVVTAAFVGLLSLGLVGCAEDGAVDPGTDPGTDPSTFTTEPDLGNPTP